MNDSDAAPSSGSEEFTAKASPPIQASRLSEKENASSEEAVSVSAEAPSNGNNSSIGDIDSSPAAPPPKQEEPPPPAAHPPQIKSPPPPSTPPPKAETSPPPPQQQSSPPPAANQESPPPPPPPPPPASPPPPTENAAIFLPPPPPPPSQSPPPRTPTPPAPPSKQEKFSPPHSPPSPSPSTSTSTSPSPPPPPSQPPSGFPSPPPAWVSQPTTSHPPSVTPPAPTGAMTPRVSVEPALPVGSSHMAPRTGSAGLIQGTRKAGIGPAAEDGNGKALPVAAGVAGVFIVALVAIFFVIARRKKKKDNAGLPGNYIPPKNFVVKSGYMYGQPHSGFFPGQMDPYNNYSYPISQQGNSIGSQRYYGSGGLPESGVLGGGKSFFSYDKILEMTNGFSAQNVIGEGGFGCVYKGRLPDGKPVAVKNLKSGGGQGDREFKAEVEIISRVHHRHLVSLVGYCIAEDHRVLIYEFVSNNTLEHHLHGKGLPVLQWHQRLKIALGAAKGLAYLHEDCHPKIIHRDIKSANILLENDFEAQVADFGLARPNTDAQTHVSTRVMGTFGYLAPEYASSGKLTDKSDVYSFGVVLLELITGRKPVDTSQPMGDESLVEWARPHLLHALETRDFSNVVDPRLQKHYVELEMFRMIEAAAACIRHSAPKRPRMMQVVRALDCEGAMSDLSNGVKYGQSTIYDSGQYDQDIQKFHRMAFGSGDFDYTEDFSTKDFPLEPQNKALSWSSRNSSGQSSGSETRPLK